VVKNKPELPTFGTLDLNQIVTTLTEVRLRKYLKVANDRPEVAMQLYVMNSAVSTAFLVDIHYVEVILRNKFASQLTEKFGLEWFKNPEFLKLINQRSKNILEKARYVKRSEPCAPVNLLYSTQARTPSTSAHRVVYCGVRRSCFMPHSRRWSSWPALAM
jgi:hypothetical protein